MPWSFDKTASLWYNHHTGDRTMGLDTFAVRNSAVADKTEPLENTLFPEDVTRHLCGGLFSGGGASFRGKVYNDFIEFATGLQYTLYEETIPYEDVVKIANALEACANEDSFARFEYDGKNQYGITLDEVKALAKWFRIVADEGGHISNWW
jgi:hypothetical protein